jgi:phosphopantothenoylcysteine decarboxylase / phosphopantothenate---cysteine ligase
LQIILGISGSISAYKTPDLIRHLSRDGITCIPVLSQNAAKFVSPLSLETVAEHHCYIDAFTLDNVHIPHLSLNKADALVIAPASANIIAKLAHGFADCVLSATALSFTGQKVIVPAMHTAMWQNPATVQNILRLKELGYRVLGPDSGDLACGDVGLGRFVDFELISLFIRALEFPPLTLTGQRLLISAGGTHTHIDPVRIITNLSSGKLGESLAHLASFFGAEVQLVTSANAISNPHLSGVHTVRTYTELRSTLEAHFSDSDVLIMAAAVSDFEADYSGTKRPREAFSLTMMPTEDILAKLSATRRPEQRVVGFCLSTDNLEETAIHKLHAKHLDIIVANTPHAIAADFRDAIIISQDGSRFSYTEVPVLELAYRILQATFR